MNRDNLRGLTPTALGLVLCLITSAACIDTPLGADSVGDDSGSSLAGGGGASSASGDMRLRCEVDASRSKISVDGNNMSSGTYFARVTSGGQSVTSGLLATVGDEVEFDFDSDPGDIAAGATAISRDFIDTAASPRVSAEILEAGGQVVVTGASDCGV